MKFPSYPPKLKTADNRCFFGAQGSGKGYRAEQCIKNETRLLIWDSMDDFNDKMVKIYGDMHALRALVRQPAFRVSFIPDDYTFRHQFDQFCKLVFGQGRMCVVVDELDEVTGASHPPAPWRSLTGRARHAGLRVYGCAQRPAEVDKRFITNASTVCVGRLTEAMDEKALRSKLGDLTKQLPALPDHEQLHWHKAHVKHLKKREKPVASGTVGALMF